MEALNDLDILARTVFGEARGELWVGKLAVAWVVRNRATQGGWWGSTIGGVCLKPWQFSCWNENDPNRHIIEHVTTTNAKYRECVAAAALVLADLEPDPTDGATHYFAQGIPTPNWAKGQRPVAIIGAHRFYRGIA